MTTHHKLTVALLAMLLSAFVYASAATAQPKVVFIGDQFTYMWGTTPSFTANPNWINQGWDSPVSTYCFLFCSAGTSGGTLARFQTDVIDLHPAIVHIMVGVDDLANDDDATQAIGGVNPGLLSNLEPPGGGYLQNVEQSENEAVIAPLTNVNSGLPGNVFQFTPYGWYNNNPLVAPFVNDTFAGSSGTWASSSPLVMSVSQTGLAWALAPGTAAITYTSPSGVKFSEWIMYVTQGTQ